MVSSTQSSASSPDTNRIQTLVKKVLQSNQLSRQEHLILSSTLLSTFQLSVCDRNQINRVFDYIRMGRVKLTD